MASSRNYKCKINPNRFCFVCADYLFGDKGRDLTPDNCDVYHQYFGIEAVRDKPWIPNKICDTCRLGLAGWAQKKVRSMRFGIPAMWREPFDHERDCYFWVADVLKHSKTSIKYPTVASVTRPVAHSENVPIPVVESVGSSPQATTSTVTSNPSSGNVCSVTDPDAVRLLTQDDLDDIVKGMNLTIDNAEFLASRLVEHNLCSKGTYKNYTIHIHENIQIVYGTNKLYTSIFLQI